VKVFENVVQGGIPENQSDVNWRYDNNSSTETNYTLTIDNQEGNFTYEKNSSLGCPFSCVNGPLCNKLQ